VVVRRGGRVHQLGLFGRGQARHGFVFAVPGQVPVACEDGGVDGLPHRQRLGDAAMQFSAFARRYLVVHGFTEQVVPEPVSLSVDHHEVGVASAAEHVRDSRRVDVQGTGHEYLVAVFSRGHDLEGCDHLVPLLGDPGHEDGAQVVRQAGASQRQYLLHQERDASGPPMQARRLQIGRSPPGDRSRQVPDLCRGERLESESGDRATAGHRIGERAQVRSGRRVLRAVCAHHAEAPPERLSEDVGQGVAGCAVAPVQVLDDQDQGSTRRQSGKRRSQGVEEFLSAHGVLGAEHAQQRSVRRERCAQARDQWGVRRALDRNTPADQGPRPFLAPPSRGLRDQPRLSHPGSTGHQRHRGNLRLQRVNQLDQSGQLGLAPDHHRTGHPRRNHRSHGRSVPHTIRTRRDSVRPGGPFV
jgi:hypothetical protein